MPPAFRAFKAAWTAYLMVAVVTYDHLYNITTKAPDKPMTPAPTIPRNKLKTIFSSIGLKLEDDYRLSCFLSKKEDYCCSCDEHCMVYKDCCFDWLLYMNYPPPVPINLYRSWFWKEAKKSRRPEKKSKNLLYIKNADGRNPSKNRVPYSKRRYRLKVR